MSAVHQEIDTTEPGASVRVLNERGAVTAEKAILTVLVIVFAWAGIHFLGDPMRNQLFRIVFTICQRIYDTIASLVFR